MSMAEQKRVNHRTAEFRVPTLLLKLCKVAVFHRVDQRKVEFGDPKLLLIAINVTFTVRYNNKRCFSDNDELTTARLVAENTRQS